MNTKGTRCSPHGSSRECNIGCRAETAGVSLGLINGGRHVLAASFGLDDPDKDRIDEQCIARWPTHSGPFGNCNVPAFGRTNTSTVSRDLGIRFPLSIPELLVNQVARARLVQIDLRRGLLALLH